MIELGGTPIRSGRHRYWPSHVIGFFGLMLALASYDNAAANSTSVAEFKYDAKLLSDPSASPFDSTIEKKDIVIMGDHVTISEWTRSFGGDIVIIANTLRLLAPLDTRPFLRVARPYWRLDGAPAPGRVAHDTLAANHRAATAFDSLYHWTEEWDAKSKKFLQIQVPSPSVEARVLGQKFEFLSASSPSAYVPHTWAYLPPVEGNDAPNVIAGSIDSGSIFIIARNIELCERAKTSCPPKVEEQKNPKGDKYDRERTGILLMADGLKGGIGSPGALPLCLASTASCNHWDNGLSGRPSAGQNGGSVTVTLLGGDVDAGLADLISRTSANGGRPPYEGRFATPRISVLGGKERDVFSLASGKSDASLFGKEGKIAVSKSSDSFAAFVHLAQTLSAIGQGKAYKFEPMVSSLGSNAFHLYVGPRDVLKSFLRNELSRFNQIILDRLEMALSGARPSSSYDFQESVVKASLFCSSQFPELLDRVEKVLLNTACKAVLWQNDPEAYLMDAGGLFRKVPSNLQDRLDATSIKAELTLLNAQTAFAIQEIQKVGVNARLLLEFHQRTELSSALRKAEEALSTAVSEAKAHETRYPADVKTFAYLAASLAGVQSALVTAEKILLSPDGGWEKAGEYLRNKRDVASPILELYKWMGAHPNRDMRSLREKVANAERNLSEFDEITRIAAIEAAKKLGAQTKSVVELALRMDSKRVANLLLFEDLLRAVLQSYSATPDKKIDRLQKNMLALKALLVDSTDGTVPLDLQGIADLCSRFKPKSSDQVTTGCVSFKGHSSSRRIFWGTINSSIELPYVVVAPGTDTVTTSIWWHPGLALRVEEMTERQWMKRLSLLK